MQNLVIFFIAVGLTPKINTLYFNVLDLVMSDNRGTKGVSYCNTGDIWWIAEQRDLLSYKFIHSNIRGIRRRL
jgi:hypothetical protein